MAAVRKRNLLSSRRRVHEEGEEEDGIVDPGDDSQSEASALTDAEDNQDAYGSELSEVDSGEVQRSSRTIVESRPVETIDEDGTSHEGESRTAKDASASSPTKSAFAPTADTNAMMNGLKPDDGSEEEEAIHFEDSMNQKTAQSNKIEALAAPEPVPLAKRESLAQRRTREHEEYKKRRESDPAFVPTRGGFFMHDHRNDGFGQAAFGSLGRGRGKGKDVISNTNPPFNVRHGAPTAEAKTGRWDHDLHDTVMEAQSAPGQKQSVARESAYVGSTSQRTVTQHPSPSKTVTIGMAMVRISLPTSKTAATFQKMTVQQHTRLPDLRPPLRRDKPVRVSLPDHGPRYVFPSTERSFVFIPRAQRPNQQAARAKSRPFINPSQSRRTSAYGGSIYDSSVSISRRSSVAPDVVVASELPLLPRPTLGAPTGSARPVVKLPSGALANQTPSFIVGSGTAAFDDHSALGHGYPPPSQPTYRETRTGQLHMHQPRPQKAVSVATIETPGTLPLHAPQQQEQQPFHHQVPAHINGQASSDVSSSVRGRQSSQIQAMQGTPISIIPEGAINAQPFQPAPNPQPTLYPPSYPTQPTYYYTTPTDGQADHYAADGLSSTLFVQQGPYFVPTFLPPPAAVDEGAASAQAGTFAQERNGMVYYYDSSQLMGSVDGTATQDYSVPGGSEIITPGSEGYYYTQGPPRMVYYPAQ